MNPIDLALLVLRVAFGIGLAAHGWNKVFGGGGLSGTAGWFGAIGMRWPALQARLAAGTEIGAGVLFALGFLTPFAAAGMVAVMLVALWVTHRDKGFFIFNEGQGWEYTAAIAVAAWAVGSIGSGEYGLDHAVGLDESWVPGEWTGMVITTVVGVGAALVQLAVSYRPPAPS
ncbi:MAG: DoxX family protein [Desertimonas sp.]